MLQKIRNIRSDAGFNSKTPVSVLEKLSNDEEWIVREWTACNVIIPVHILDKLSKDKNHKVRTRIAIGLFTRNIRFDSFIGWEKPGKHIKEFDYRFLV